MFKVVEAKLPGRDGDAPKRATLAGVSHLRVPRKSKTRAHVVVAEFERDPDLPGAIVVDGDEVIGVLSRHALEHLSHPFGTSLFRDGPIERMLDDQAGPPLVLAEDMPIDEAANFSPQPAGASLRAGDREEGRRPARPAGNARPDRRPIAEPDAGEPDDPASDPGR